MFDWLNQESEMSDFDRQMLSSNIVGAKTLSQLSEIEREITEVKTRELKSNPRISSGSGYKPNRFN